MDIIAAYREAGTYRGAAEIAGMGLTRFDGHHQGFAPGRMSDHGERG